MTECGLHACCFWAALQTCLIVLAFVGDALITFNYERHAINCIDDHAPGKLQQLLAFVPCIQQGRKKAPRLDGSVITVVRYSMHTPCYPLSVHPLSMSCCVSSQQRMLQSA